VCLLLSNLLQIGIPWALQRGIDGLRVPGGTGVAERYALLIAALALLQAVIRIASRITIFNAGRNVEYDLRTECAAHLCTLPPSFYRRHPTGDLMSRMTNDLSSVRVMFGFGALNIVNTAFTYSLVLWRLVAIDGRLTLLAILPYPLLVLCGRAFSRVFFRQNREAMEQLGQMSTAAQEDFSGIGTVKHYALEDVRGRSFERLCRDFLRSNMRLTGTRGLMGTLLGFLGALGTLVVLYVGGRAVIAGRLTLGQFAAFNMYLLQLAWPTMALGFLMGVWQRGMASWARLRDVLATQPTLRDGVSSNGRERVSATASDGVSSNGRERVRSYGRSAQREAGPPPPLDPDVELEVRGLSLTVDGCKVLDGVSLRLPPGHRLAVVGRTGCGKSTLAEVLARLQEVPDGTVFWGGQDVNTLPLGAVRRAIGYAPQEAFLFSATLRENIELGRRDSGAADPTAPTLEALCAAAGLTRDLAAFPAGLDTVVGERGITLSGGQRQRVALARALATRPRLLILDDSLSAVDAETEGDILSGLSQMAAGSSAVIISHRVAAVKDADEIVVLEGGRVVERGRHRELLAQGGLYAELYQRQVLESEIAGLPVPAGAAADGARGLEAG
jgi:ATP-binding cassette subfamily B protein